MMNRKFFFVGLFLLVTCQVSVDCRASEYAQENRNPSVGAAGLVDEIILPGSKLVALPVTNEAPMIVRIKKSFQHGDGYRYHIEFTGMEPGKYNLAEYLVREDGTSTDGLPEIPVEIKTILPPGQIQPNELGSGWLPQMGGYRAVMFAAATLWVLGLLALIFVGRKSKADTQPATQQKTSLAEMLKPRLQAAIENRLQPAQYAELERMLVAFWRKRLELESLPPEQALTKIKQDEHAGPLMLQLEQWLHSPHRDENVDLAALLKPLQYLSVDESEFSQAQEHSQA